MIIVYCEKCGRRVSDSDVDEGRAVQVEEHKWMCGACVPVPAPAPAPGRAATQPMKALASSSRQRKTATAVQRKGPAADSPPREKSSKLMIGALAAAGLMLAAGLIVLIVTRSKNTPQARATESSPAGTAKENPRGSGPVAGGTARAPALSATPANAPDTKTLPASPASPASPAPPAPPPAPPRGGEEASPATPAQALAERARQADKEMEEYRNHRATTLLEEAQAWFKQNPADPWSYQAKLSDIAKSYGTAPGAVEARKRLDEMKNLPPPPDRLDGVPEARDFQLVYDMDLSKIGADIPYVADRRGEIKGSFDRIAYFMELQPASGEWQYLYVSMDAFTADVNKIGVPTAASGARFQQNVASMNVYSNVKGVVTGTGLSGGNIEFWPSNYSPRNAASVPNADSGKYDFGDEAQQGAGHGSMQVHNHEARQTLFALNRWSHGGGAELGIGNQPAGHPDWTFANNAASYRAKRLRVLVHLK